MVLGPPLAEGARFLGRLLAFGVRAAERDERHDVERAEPRVLALVADDREVLGDRGGQRPGGVARRRARPGRRG